MKVRDKKQTWEGISNGFNTCGLGEVIVGFLDDEGMDSMFINELEVFLDSKQEWKDMSQAFKDNDIIPDNFNTCFREPRNTKERENGYY
ncbi:hypothetical protein ACV3UV_11920 [Clostridium perfringens]